MIASILILVVSLVLLVYWFRYTCMLLLRASAVEYAGTIAAVNRLSFLEVRQKLENTVGNVGLDALERSLEKDYRILRYLLEHSAELGMPAIEERLLVIDYHLMQVWYKVARHCSNGMARRALDEMSGVLSYFAQKMGEHVAQQSAV